MYKDIINKISDKKMAILGFGKEGQSTYSFIRRYLPNKKLTIIDQNEKLKDECDFIINDKNISIITGKNYLMGLEKYDLIIKSPGISFKDIDTSQFISKVTSQFALLLEESNNLIIGITGSKGKSTTTSLIYKVLKDQSCDVCLLGNIGIPPFDYIDKINEHTILVIEMAALQLEYLKKSPHISLILNLYEEHLNFFGTMEKYYQAKLNIFKYQKENDYSLYSSDNEVLNKYVRENNFRSNLIEITYTKDTSNLSKNAVFCDEKYIYIKSNNKIKKIYDINQKRNLLGRHNLHNIMFVFGVCNILKLDLNKAIETINTFKGLEHRMEKVATIDGVTFYNDVIATIPSAVISCIEALKKVDTLILGGMDRGISYEEFIEYLVNSNINNFICMPESGIKIGKKIKEKSFKNVYFIDDLKEVIIKAKEITKKGKICLLSPAAPSYNMYKNFEEKGRAYKKIVNSLRDNKLN